MSRLSDKKFESVKERLNSAIHEIVFAVQHVEDDNLEDAGTCLVTAQGTIEHVAEELIDAGFEHPATQNPQPTPP